MTWKKYFIAADIRGIRLIVGTQNNRNLAIELNVSDKQHQPTSPRQQQATKIDDLNTDFVKMTNKLERRRVSH